MISSIKNGLEKLNQENPKWIDEVKKHPELWQENPEDDSEEWVKIFSQIVLDICRVIRRGEASKEEILDLFDEKMKDNINSFLSASLRPYYAFQKIQKLEKESLTQIKYMLDIIWEQYVIRFNPELKIEPFGNLKEEEISEIETTLEALAFFCVVRTFSYEGIVSALKYQLELSDELTEHIAKRIDRDYRELQINFLIKKMDQFKIED